MTYIAGQHHTSMITKDANKNNHFYKNILGLRRVKMTVNQDDPSMYHLFFGDEIGSPGTELTFFEIPMAGRTHKGTNSITRIGLLVPSYESLLFWSERFKQLKVKHGEITEYTQRPSLSFEDPDGLQLVLIVSEQSLSFWRGWSQSLIPKEHQIMGMGPVEMTVRRPEKLQDTLVNMFGYSISYREEKLTVYQSLAGEPFGEIVVIEKDGPDERPGRGSVHHLAIRVKDEEELKYWESKVREKGFLTNGIIDRYYFKSLYFRESNGILFEIATDGPGFTIDTDLVHLGETLDLPPFLEERREEIEKMLKPIEENE